MDIILVVLGFGCMLLGLLGSLLPVIPGLSLSWIGLVVLHCTEPIPMNFWTLGALLFIVLFTAVLNYTIPARTTKRYGGSKYAIWGTNIGLLIGILTPIPFGFIFGPFFGALIGELIYENKKGKKALRVASGSLISFIWTTLLNFVISTAMLGYYVILVWQFKEELF